MRYRYVDQLPEPEETSVVHRPRPVRANLDIVLTRWSGLVAVGWAALAGLMFTQSLWVAPSSLTDAMPALYEPLIRLLPAFWIHAPRFEGWGRILASALYLLVMLWLWAGYRGAVRVVADANPQGVQAGRGLFRRIMLGLLVFSGLTLPWPGLLSSDVYLYGAQGRMQVLLGLNPLVAPPRLLGHDPLLAMTPWGDMLSTYGPVWLAVERLAAMLGDALGGEPAVYVLLYKLLNLGLLMLGTRLFWAITGQLAWPVARRAQATMLFAWCPLVVLEFVASAHNDMLLVLLLLLAVWLHLRGFWPLAVTALVLSGLVKMPGFFLLPAYLVLLWRTRPSRASGMVRVGGSLGLAVLLCCVAYLPYMDPMLPRVLLANPMAGFVSNSINLPVRTALVAVQLHLRGLLAPENLTPREALEAVRWLVWYVPLALWAAISAVFIARVRDWSSLLFSWALTMYVYLVIASPWFQPWYITWLVPVLALLPGGRMQRAGLLLAVGGTLFYAVFPSLPGDTALGTYSQYYIPAFVFLPTLCYWLWEGRGVLRRRWVPVEAR